MLVLSVGFLWGPEAVEMIRGSGEGAASAGCVHQPTRERPAFVQSPTVSGSAQLFGREMPNV